MEKVLPQQRGNFFCLKCPGFWIVEVCAEGEPRKTSFAFAEKILAFFEFLFYNDFRTNVFFGFQFVEWRRAA